ncbi:MAG: hypothetical protein WHS44_06185 [Fimbriimonadales bacterium]|nr:MAG: hypothetical protein KatS3mg018_1006 [Fimbriimonadales bacterium]
MQIYTKPLMTAFMSGVAALVGVLGARSAWSASDALHWQDVLWWCSFAALFWTGQAITRVPEARDDENDSQGKTIVIIRLPASVFSVLLIVAPLGITQLTMSLLGTPLDLLALLRLIMAGIAIGLAGLVWGAPERRPLASLARYLRESVAKARLAIMIQEIS